MDSGIKHVFVRRHCQYVQHLRVKGGMNEQMVRGPSPQRSFLNARDETVKQIATIFPEFHQCGLPADGTTAACEHEARQCDLVVPKQYLPASLSFNLQHPFDAQNGIRAAINEVTELNDVSAIALGVPQGAVKGIEGTVNIGDDTDARECLEVAVGHRDASSADRQT
jgi:hypothetical protein